VSEFIQSNGGLIATVVLVVVAFNAVIMGLHKGLELIKDKTATDTDNKIYEVLGKVISVFQKIIELAAAYKPTVKDEVKPDGVSPQP